MRKVDVRRVVCCELRLEHGEVDAGGLGEVEAALDAGVKEEGVEGWVRGGDPFRGVLAVSWGKTSKQSAGYEGGEAGRVLCSPACNLIQLRDVERIPKQLPLLALVAILLRNLLQSGLSPPHQDHRPAFAEEPLCHGVADAAGGTEQQDGLVREVGVGHFTFAFSFLNNLVMLGIAEKTSRYDTSFLYGCG